MSTRAELLYNPYTQAASLTLDYRPIDRQDGRLYTFISNKPFDDWLRPATRSYQQWMGFLPELMAATNDEQLGIVFIGTSEDFTLFKSALAAQTDGVAEAGFDTDQWDLAFVEKYSPRLVVEEMRAARASWNVRVPTQRLLFKLDELDGALLNAPPETIDQVRDMHDAYLAFIDDMLHKIIEAIPDYTQRAREVRAQWQGLLR